VTGAAGRIPAASTARRLLGGALALALDLALAGIPGPRSAHGQETGRTVDLRPLIPHPSVPPRAAFPWVWRDDDPAPASLRHRAEGLSLVQNALAMGDYLRKYAEGRATAPTELLAHMERARAVIRRERQTSTGSAQAVTVAFAGDLMWLRRGWDDYPDAALLDELRCSDAVVANLESPVAQGLDVPALLPDYVRYNSAPGLVQALKRADGRPVLTAVSVANNHALDRGDEGLSRTLAFLEREGVVAVGAGPKESPHWKPMRVGPFTLGLYAACWGTNDPAAAPASAWRVETLPGLAPPGARPVDLDAARAALSQMASAGVDLKVVLLHWGHEYELYPSPLQLVVARELAAAGADLVVGTHPHVPQPAEVCEVLPGGRGPAGSTCVMDSSGAHARRALILYSLGNFASAMVTVPTQVGVVERLRLWRDDHGLVQWALAHPLLVVNQPAGTLAPGHRLLRLQEALSDPTLPAERRDALRHWAVFLLNHLAADPGRWRDFYGDARPR
jgi:poly-gamma-glutamate capsule biosynthesis protein CapA/YwtB (metallophosphatase superfamily)